MRRSLVVLLLAAIPAGACSQSDELVRSHAVRDQAYARGVKDEAILAALRGVPREPFLAPDAVASAYADGPAKGQGAPLPSIYLVGLVLSLVHPRGDDRVLDVGTATGYQAAVAAKLVAKVHSMDTDAARIAEAEERWRALGLSHISARTGDATDGWSSAAPFDVIILWTAPPYIPPMLMNQLQLGGRMVILSGPIDAPTQLRIIEKKRDRSISERIVVPTAK